MEDGLHCIICFQQREYFCVSSCDHAVCLTCVIRITMLNNSKECPVCRVVMGKIIAFDGDKDNKKKFVDVLDIPHVTGSVYEKNGIFFTNRKQKQFADGLLSHVCQICENKMTFPTFDLLEVHMRHEHERFSCDICTHNLVLFSEERQFFTRVALAKHRRIGNNKMLGERGHPLCKFCDERYFDNDMLFRHCRNAHYFCHFCTNNKMNDFFPTLDALKDHFRSNHFFCELDNCANEPHGVVFENKIDYQIHMNSNHFNTMDRSSSRSNRCLLEVHGEFEDWHAGSKRRSKRLETLLENKQKEVLRPSVQQSFHLENEEFPNLNPDIASSSGVQSNNNCSSTAVTKNWKMSKEVALIIDDFPPLSSSNNAPVDDTAEEWSQWSTVNSNKRKGKKSDFSKKGGKTELLSHASSTAAKANSELVKNRHLYSTSSKLSNAEQMFLDDNAFIEKKAEPSPQYENEFPELPVKDSMCNNDASIQWFFTNKRSKQVAKPKQESTVLKNLKANQPSQAHQSQSKKELLFVIIYKNSYFEELVKEKHSQVGSSTANAKNLKRILTMNRDADFPPLVNENSTCNTAGMSLTDFKGKLQSKPPDVVKIDVTVNETQKMLNNADEVEFPSLPGSKDVHTAGNAEYSAKTSANYSAAILKVQNVSSTAKLKKNAKERQQASLNEVTTVIQPPFHAQHDNMKLEQKNTKKSDAHIGGKQFKDKAALRSNDHQRVQNRSSQKNVGGKFSQAAAVKLDSAERMKKEAKSNCFNFFLHVKYPEIYEKCLPYIKKRSGRKSGEFLKLPQYEEQSANLRERLVVSMSDGELASFENLLNNFQEGRMLGEDFFSEMMHQLGEVLFLSIFPEIISLLPNVDMQKKLLRCYIAHCVDCGEDLQVRFKSVDLCHICSQMDTTIDDNAKVAFTNPASPPIQAWWSQAGGIVEQERIMKPPSRFEVHIRFCCLKPENAETTFKVDGRRFNMSTKTLKLYRDTTYRIGVTSSPPMEFEEAEINGENLISHLEPDGGIEADWSTAGFSKTKSRSRCTIRLMLRGVFGSVTQDLQCKFYDISDPHAQWGDKFRQMVLVCSTYDDCMINVVEVELK
ncbi:Zinc finger protein [Trichinella zimbabwensis]|uniref:Zinc finger protein n=1 Tax=Trichinella zimbabwensis TaxID=268475 RepID=A0A0V1HVD3_9BILA|nr:Zinc finger protein [Trichinella zimbabwensis]